MLKGLQGQNPTFLADLSKIQSRIAVANRQITSGYKINQASDDATALTSILKYQGQIDHLTQTQTNLSLSQAETQTADGALQTAATILNQLTSIASQGASDTSSQDTRAILGDRVKQLAQQLVMVANTSINGRHVFGGDNPGVAPFTFSWPSSPNGVTRNSTAGATGLIDDGNGLTTSAGMTAADIFDSGTNSIFKAAYDLSQALTTNNSAGILAAVDSLSGATTYLTQVSASYGERENWIQQASDSATNQITQLTQQLASVREADLPAAITDLTTNQTALQAALSAHASLSTKTLFDYFG